MLCRVMSLQQGNQRLDRRQAAMILRPAMLALEKAIEKYELEPMLQ